MSLELYMAHPAGSAKEMNKWAKGFKHRTGIHLINPFDNEKPVNEDWYYNKINPNEIVERDLKLIRSSDGMIALINGDVSYGTIQEMVYAKQFKKPVYSAITNGQHNHPFLVYHSDEVFRCLGELEKFMAPGCHYCPGTTNLVGQNKKHGFNMYLCNDCEKSWMELDKEDKNNR